MSVTAPERESSYWREVSMCCAVGVHSLCDMYVCSAFMY